MLESAIISGVSIFIFVLGIITHRYCLDIGENVYSTNIKSLGKKYKEKINSSIQLDETKVVLKIDTSNLEKKSEIVGETTIAHDDTASAINKLKHMKGK